MDGQDGMDEPTISTLNGKYAPKEIAQRCPVCNGFGTLKYGAKTCQACNGKGFVLVPAVRIDEEDKKDEHRLD